MDSSSISTLDIMLNVVLNRLKLNWLGISPRRVSFSLSWWYDFLVQYRLAILTSVVDQYVIGLESVSGNITSATFIALSIVLHISFSITLVKHNIKL